MQAYPVRITGTVFGVSVSFPDIPELLGFGRNAKEALSCARRDLRKVRKLYPKGLPSPTKRAAEELYATLTGTARLSGNLAYLKAA